jgi:hypothetical protein
MVGKRNDKTRAGKQKMRDSIILFTRLHHSKSENGEKPVFPAGWDLINS